MGSRPDAALREQVQQAAGHDHRVTTALAHADDAEVVREVGAAELVVLPYRDMGNSGAALLALSLDRPVLLPANAVTRALAAEVGADWVLTYPGDLTPQVLQDAAARAAARRPGSRPDLSAREWPDAGRAHAEVYALATGGTR
ncbi:hypothetical protein GCM10025868_14590 [Angustibacter aerolatus]|uniref:Glycosyl transferase family 28 C-terminal domain-containing protein n=1 Tax=Angustibacter aerolatus TaxID=1162965 RepID=A0ABQ6JGE2_9ACTN|nr:hypothetical protein GCM10025868_14590 [Angustibacter aerolatus]